MNNTAPSTDRKWFSGKKVLLLLLALLLADCFFILLDIAHATIPFFRHYRYDSGHDGSLAEIFQYIKWFLILCLLARIARSRQSASYWSWFAFILFFLADDSLQIHERAGAHIAGILPFTAPLGLRQQDIGELAVVAIAGSLLLAGVLYAYRKGDALFKRVSLDMLCFLLALGVFAIMIDMACYLSFVGLRLHEFLLTLDDTGEMIIASGMLGYVYWISLAPDRPKSSFIGRLFSKSRSPANPA